MFTATRLTGRAFACVISVACFTSSYAKAQGNSPVDDVCNAVPSGFEMEIAEAGHGPSSFEREHIAFRMARDGRTTIHGKAQPSGFLTYEVSFAMSEDTVLRIYCALVGERRVPRRCSRLLSDAGYWRVRWRIDGRLGGERRGALGCEPFGDMLGISGLRIGGFAPVIVNDIEGCDRWSGEMDVCVYMNEEMSRSLRQPVESECARRIVSNVSFQGLRQMIDVIVNETLLYRITANDPGSSVGSPY